MGGKINGTQIKLIHIAKAELKLSDEEYRSLLSARYWVNTCTELSYKDASDLIDYFKAQGFKIKHRRGGSCARPSRRATTRVAPTKRKLPPEITQLPSPGQLKIIDHLKADVKWIVKPDGYDRWLVKYLKKDHITTGKEAQHVIEALKAMKARQQRTAKAQADSGDSFHDLPVMNGGHYEW